MTNSQESSIALIADALSDVGYCVIDNALDDDLNQYLLRDCQTLDQAKFRAAGMGRAHTHHYNQTVRGDYISWQHADHDNPILKRYFDWIEQLRLGLNRQLYLGLFDYECHYAHYPSGAFYRKHLDSFKAQPSRRVSTILYLNPTWQPEHGGELVLYNESDTDIIETIAPLLGRMVCFLSERFPHEVLPTTQARYSLTGWYRINNNHSTRVDPAQ